MSRFRTFIESFAKNVYVEGLSLEESCLVALYEDVLTDHFPVEYNKDNKELPQPPIVNFTNYLDKEISEMQIKIGDQEYPVEVAFRNFSGDQGKSFYGYAIIYKSYSKGIKRILGIDFEEAMPIEVVYRSSDHSKTRKRGNGDNNNDVDVFVPGDQYNTPPYIKDAFSDPLFYNFFDRQKVRVDGQKKTVFTYDYRDKYAETAKEMLQPAFENRMKECVGVCNNFLDHLIKEIKSHPGQQWLDQDFKQKLSKGEYKHGSKTPRFNKWLSNLLVAVLSNIQDVSKHIMGAGQQSPTQDKAASFQQATQKTTALAKMAQAQKDIDTVVSSPDKER